jgi:hypothetical protein
MSVINNISLTISSPLPSTIRSCTIKRNVKEFSNDVFGLFLEGHIQATTGNLHRVDFYCEDLKFDRAMLGKDIDRSIGGTLADKLIRKLFGNKPEKGRFEAAINLIELPPTTEIEVYGIVGADQDKYRVATINVDRAPLTPSYRAKRTPILLTSMGRSGTTWFMSLLREHPKVYVYEEYPHEMLMIEYYTNMLVALSSPISGDRLLDKWHLRDFQKRSVSPNVFYRNDVLDAGTITYLGNQYVRDLADFCLQNIDKAYDCLIENYAKTAKIENYNPVYFSEKGLIYRSLVRELYPGAKQLFLLRDVRDNISSALAFNEKRGTQEFGRAAAKSDEEFIEQRCAIFNQRFNEYKKYRNRACLVRYEDLVKDPRKQIINVLSYLGLDNDENTVDEMFNKANESSKKMSFHKTSSESGSSVERWRVDLPREHREMCWEYASTALDGLGYSRE